MVYKSTLLDTSTLDGSSSSTLFPLPTKECSNALLISSAVQSVPSTAAHQLSGSQLGKNQTKSGPANFSLTTWTYKKLYTMHAY